VQNTKSNSLSGKGRSEIEPLMNRCRESGRRKSNGRSRSRWTIRVSPRKLSRKETKRPSPHPAFRQLPPTSCPFRSCRNTGVWIIARASSGQPPRIRTIPGSFLIIRFAGRKGAIPLRPQAFLQGRYYRTFLPYLWANGYSRAKPQTAGRNPRALRNRH